MIKIQICSCSNHPAEFRFVCCYSSKIKSSYLQIHNECKALSPKIYTNLYCNIPKNLEFLYQTIPENIEYLQ